MTSGRVLENAVIRILKNRAVFLLRLTAGLLGLLALNRHGDLIRHGGEELQVALAISVFLFVMLHCQDADGAGGSPQGYTQPGSRSGPALCDRALFEQLRLEFFCQQQRLARPQHVAGSSVAFVNWLRRRDGIKLVDPELEMH